MIKRIFFLIIVSGLFTGVAHGEVKWKEAKFQHFIVYYKTAPQDFVDNVAEMAESYYDEISDNLGFTRYKSWSYDDRAKIYIYDDEKDYVISAQQSQWSHGSASPKDKIIRTFPAAHGFFDSTLPHEMGHIIFREFVGFEAQVPLWFEEGVAMYQEKAKRWGVDQVVKQAITDDIFIPVKDLTHLRLDSNSNIQLVNLFYAESASLINYLINELGKQRFVNLCRELQKGNRFEDSFRVIYIRFQNMDDLNKAWVNYLKQ